MLKLNIEGNYMRSKMLKRTTLLVLLYLFALALFAQEENEIMLLDNSSYLPIVGASFEYGGQSGESDIDGQIKLIYKEGETLKLSHISYGKWQLEESSILFAIRTGVTYKERQSVNLYPVTVVAVRPRSDEVELFDLDYIDKMAHDGGALLSQSAAISGIRKSGGYGFDPVLRGFKYDQLNIVLNGTQCATAACPNRMDPPTSQMAPNMMERIEVLKGPYALRYGGGFAGTINFIPAPLRFSNKPQMYGRLTGGFESNGDLLRNEGLLGISGEGYDVGLFASWSQGNDYEDGNGGTVQSDFTRGSIGTNIGLKLGSNKQLRVSAIRNFARDADFAALPMDLRDDDTWMFNARYDASFGEDNLNSWNASLFGSFVDHLMDNLLKDINPRMVNASTNAKTKNYGGRAESIWRFNNSSLYTGADFRIESAEGTRVREFIMGPNIGKVFYDNAWQKSQIAKVGAFAEYQLNYQTYRFIFSGRVEYNSSDISDAAQEFVNVYAETDETQINPSVSLGGIYNIQENMSIGMWIGRSQRSASLTERFINYFPIGQDPYELLGNPKLDPEVINQIDFTLDWKDKNSAINVDVFASYMQEFISSVIDTNLKKRLPTTPGVRQFVNLDKAFKTGFEVNWSQKYSSWLNSNVSLAYTYAEDLERNEPLPEIAPLDIRLSFFGYFLNNKLKPEFTVRHAMEQSRVSIEYGESTTPGFTIVDLKISYQVYQMLGNNSGCK
jgi:iron complex outermembrane receptor protein